MHTVVSIWRLGDDLEELVLYFHHLGSGIFRLGSNPFPTDPSCVLECAGTQTILLQQMLAECKVKETVPRARQAAPLPYTVTSQYKDDNLHTSGDSTWLLSLRMACPL